MERKNNGIVLTLYNLVQVKTLAQEIRDNYLIVGYGLYDFVQVDGAFDNEDAPHEEFAKFVFNNAIKETILKGNINTVEALENSHRVTMTQSEWVETISEAGHKAFDTAVLVTAFKLSGDQHDVCTAFFRVEVKTFEHKMNID